MAITDYERYKALDNPRGVLSNYRGSLLVIITMSILCSKLPCEMSSGERCMIVRANCVLIMLVTPDGDTASPINIFYECTASGD